MAPSSVIGTSVPPADIQPQSPTPATAFRRIAVCVDSSEISKILVRHAATLAAAFGAPLTILRVLETEANADNTPSDPLEWGIRQREARAHLDQLVSLAGHRDIDLQSELIQGRAAEQICHWVLQRGADLVVLASHGQHGRSEWTLSSTARKLVDAVPGSLLLVRADGGRCEASAARYPRIMVPLDGSARAESVLPIATRLAHAHEAELLIAHVTPAAEHCGKHCGRYPPRTAPSSSCARWRACRRGKSRK